MPKDIAELRAIIARCCEEADAASKVARDAMRVAERESERRQAAIRELRSLIRTLEVHVGLRRAR